MPCNQILIAIGSASRGGESHQFFRNFVPIFSNVNQQKIILGRTVVDKITLCPANFERANSEQSIIIMSRFRNIQDIDGYLRYVNGLSQHTSLLLGLKQRGISITYGSIRRTY